MLLYFIFTRQQIKKWLIAQLPISQSNIRFYSMQMCTCINVHVSIWPICPPSMHGVSYHELGHVDL